MASAVVFPGQGGQETALAMDFHACFEASREVFAEASEAVGLDVKTQCLEEVGRRAPPGLAPVALITSELAMLRALERELGCTAAWFGGHGLGEYTALCAAGALPLAVALRLVHRRGALLQDVAAGGARALAEVVSEDIGERGLGSVLEGLDVVIAERNVPDRLVLSGDAAQLEIACGRLRKFLRGTEHRIAPLGAHSPLTASIEARFRDELRAAAPSFNPVKAATVTSNFSGSFHVPTSEALVDALAGQLGGCVDLARQHARAGRPRHPTVRGWAGPGAAGVLQENRAGRHLDRVRAAGGGGDRSVLPAARRRGSQRGNGRLTLRRSRGRPHCRGERFDCFPCAPIAHGPA